MEPVRKGFRLKDKRFTLAICSEPDGAGVQVLNRVRWEPAETLFISAYFWLFVCHSPRYFGGSYFERLTKLLLICTEKVQAANRKKLTTLKVHKGRPFHVSHITASIRVARCNSPNCNSKLTQLCFVRGLPVKIAYQGVKYTFFFILAGFPWYNSHFGAKYQVLGVASTCGHDKQPC